MAGTERKRTSILHAKQVPYFFALMLAAMAWIVSQSTDRLFNQPVLEVDIGEAKAFANENYQCGNDDKQASHYFQITLTSLAPGKRIDHLTAYVRTQGNAEVKAGRILESAPSWSQTTAPTCNMKILTFDLEGIQPFTSVVAEIVTSSPDLPVFHFESISAVRVKKAGVETWIASKEIAIYAWLLGALIFGTSLYAMMLWWPHEAG